MMPGQVLQNLVKPGLLASPERKIKDKLMCFQPGKIAAVIVLQFFMQGCFLLPQGGRQSQLLTTAKIPSYQQILAQNLLEEKTIGGRLWDRTEFLLGFPLQLFAISGVIEQENSFLAQSTSKQSFFFSFPQNDVTSSKMLQSSSASQRGLGLEILRMSQPLAVATELEIKRALLDNEPYVRLVAAHILSNGPNVKNFPQPTAEKFLEEPNEAVRCSLLQLLSKNPHPSKNFILYQALKDPSPLVRGESAKILGDGGKPENISELQKLLQDPEEYVREHAAQAIAKIRVNCPP